MEGLAAACNIFAVFSIVKDTYEICQEIRSSFIKVKRNRRTLKDLKDKVKNDIKFIENYEEKYKSNVVWTDFSPPLQDLKQCLTSIQKECGHILKKKDNQTLLGIFREWLDSDKIEEKIQCLEANAKMHFDRMNARYIVETAIDVKRVLFCIEEIMKYLKKLATQKDRLVTDSSFRDKSEKTTFIYHVEDTVRTEPTAVILRRSTSQIEMRANERLQSSSTISRKLSCSALPRKDASSHLNVQTTYLSLPSHPYHDNPQASTSSLSLQSECLPPYDLNCPAEEHPLILQAIPPPYGYSEDDSKNLYGMCCDHEKEGRLQNALEALEETIKIQRVLAKTPGSSARCRRQLFYYLKHSIRLLTSQPVKIESEIIARSQELSELVEKGAANGEFSRQELAVAFIALSRRLYESGECVDAIPGLMKALDILSDLRRKGETDLELDIARANFHLSSIYVVQKDDKKACIHAKEATKELGKLISRTESLDEYFVEIAAYYKVLILASIRKGDHESVRHNLKELIRLFGRLGESYKNGNLHNEVSETLYGITDRFYASEDYETALPAFEAIVKHERAVYRELLKKWKSEKTHSHGNLAISLRQLSKCFFKLNQIPDALEAIEEAIDIHSALVREHGNGGDECFDKQLSRDKEVHEDMMRRIGRI